MLVFGEFQMTRPPPAISLDKKTVTRQEHPFNATLADIAAIGALNILSNSVSVSCMFPVNLPAVGLFFHTLHGCIVLS
jgi:hypothetical protein